MSIFAEITSRLGDGTLVELEPRRPSETCRRLLMTRELCEEIKGEQVRESVEARYAQLEADLEIFVTRPQLSPEYLFGLTPVAAGVWEIRSLLDPQIRVFGLFLSQDIFFATHFEMRRDLGTLGGRKWSDEIRSATNKFSQLFPGFSPLVTGDINQVITGAMDGKYFK